MSRPLFGIRPARLPTANITKSRRGAAVAVGTLAAIVVGSFAGGNPRAQTAGVAAAGGHSAVNMHPFVPTPVRQRNDIAQFMNGLNNRSNGAAHDFGREAPVSDRLGGTAFAAGTSQGVVVDGSGAVYQITAPSPSPSGTLTPTPTRTPNPSGTPTPTPAPTPAPPAGGQKVNIFAYSAAANPTATVASLPPEVNGVSWNIAWSTIEPSPGVYDWSKVDAALNAASASGRRSMLRIVAGSQSPSWVTPTVTFSATPYGPVPPHQVTMPVPWSPTFLSAWTNFIAAYGARYDGNPKIAILQMAGAGIAGEMNLGGWVLPGGGNGWTAPPPTGAGATDANVTTAWNTIIDAYRAAFPRTSSALDIGDPLLDGKVLPSVMAHTQSSYGRSVVYQQNGLRAGMTLSGTYPKTLLGASANTMVGWQMWGGAGSSGDLMTAFATALSTHAGYVEVYLNDCINPANAAALRYLAAG